MKKPLAMANIAALTVIIAAPAAFAQEDEGGLEISPVEGYTCNYKDGKGPADLNAVIDGWNSWMDENDNNDYFAATMTPYYHGPDSFDVAWIGAAATAEMMGAGVDAYREVGAEQAAAFGGVVECDSHTNYATVTIKEAPARETPEDLVISFSDCSVVEGKNMNDAFAAMDEWSAFQIERGYGNGAWAWFPVYGAGGEQSFDFKLVEAYDSHAAMGADWDKMASGDYIKNGELMDSSVQCDVARVYNAKIRRRQAVAE